MGGQDPEIYMYFSSQELMAYFRNNIKEKDIKTQCRRILEMARVFMAKKDFGLEDIYSIAVMVRNIQDSSRVDEIFRLYFKPDRYPVRVMIEIDELEDDSDLEMEFSAFKGDKKYFNHTSKRNKDIPASQAVVIENYIHTSSIAPQEFDTQVQPETKIEDFDQHVRLCINNLQAILEECGSSLEQVYSIMVYLKDISLLPRVEESFAEVYFAEQDISKQVIQVLQLSSTYDVEISCSANLTH